MQPFVRFRGPGGAELELVPGDVIGRHAAAALVLDDARISEAHAMVSLRGDHLKLLALRGRFRADHRVQSDIRLVSGLRVELARGYELEVLHVELPDAVLALQGEGLSRQILGSVNSLLFRPEPELRSRYVGDAAAVVWSAGESWRLRLGPAGAGEARAGEGGPLLAGGAVPLQAGDSFEVAGRRFEAVLVPLAGATPTAMNSVLDGPLRVVATYDTVHIHRMDQCLVTLNGVGARLVSELVAAGLPLSWEAVAAELWSDDADRTQLRRRLDTSLARLRRRLRAARVRPDLVRSDGCGHLELFLMAGDHVEDRT